jgi:pSer/pThr/pTyr-binding forkhead associated (FHA) protein
MSDAIKTIVVKDASGQERLIPFEESAITIGREPSCTVRVESPYVSRRHASIEPRNGEAVLVDFGGRNGSFLNGERVEGMAELHPGDIIAIADITIECLAESVLEGATRTFTISKRVQEGPPDRMRVDAQAYEVYIGPTKLEKRLSAQEFELLAYLYAHRERVCQRQELGDAIWGSGNWDPNMLHRLIHRLKEKVEPVPEKPRYIQTIPWVGYRLTE